jgi:hypothetical protein
VLPAYPNQTHPLAFRRRVREPIANFLPLISVEPSSNKRDHAIGPLRFPINGHQKIFLQPGLVLEQKHVVRAKEVFEVMTDVVYKSLVVHTIRNEEIGACFVGVAHLNPLVVEVVAMTTTGA